MADNEGSRNDSWQEIWRIFDAAIARPPAERQAFVDQACGDDRRLRRAVYDMLAADDETDSFLDHPLASHGASSEDALGGDAGKARLPARGAETHGTLARGTLIGPYRVLGKCGQGGMSTVYLAERADDVFPRRVALKLVRPGMESEAILNRLRIERRILASLEHPHIARLYDGGSTEEGLPYFVMEYVEGVAIDAHCDQNQLSLEERLELFCKVCESLHYAHQNLVVHRDIKPSNILVTAAGEPKLLDFGIAKLLSPEFTAGVEPTRTWQRILTPSYASPEQLRGQLITTVSDVYSLGVLLYRLLTGCLPYSFAGWTPQEIESQIAESEPPPPSVVVGQAEEDTGLGGLPEAKTLSRSLSGDLDAIVLKALRSSPRHRYGSVERLAADIARYLAGQPVSARAGSWRYRAGKFVRRNRSALAGAAAVGLMVVGFAGAMTLQADRVTFERDQARLERDKKSQVLDLVLELFALSNPYVVPGEELTVREALKRSVPLLNDAVRDQPDVRAELLHTSGSILAILYDLEPARVQLQEALDIRRELYGEQHPEVAQTTRALAGVLRELGKYEPAEDMARRALEIARRVDGQEASEASKGLLSRSLNTLVSVMCYQDQYDRARDYAMEAVDLTRELSGHQEARISALEYFAVIRNDDGLYAEAADLRRESLEIQRMLYGDQHPELIPSLNNLGLSLRRLDDYTASEKVYREALAIQLENFGPEHPDPWVLSNLGAVLYARGDNEQAEAVFREGLAAVLDMRGPEHVGVFAIELWIARTRIRQDAAGEAEVSLRPLLARWERKLGDHWRIHLGRSVLAESISVQGRCAEAEPLLLDSFHRLMERPRERTKRDVFWRLRDHLERCGQPDRVVHYEALLEASLDSALTG
ncbi:MAG: serine/threonine-protein kinase [Acidobacteriota bacterium]